jgi:exportin-1
MFTETLTTVSNVIPLSLDLKQTYAMSNGRDQEFVSNLALFLSSFFSAHLDVRIYRIHCLWLSWEVIY